MKGIFLFIVSISMMYGSSQAVTKLQGLANMLEEATTGLAACSGYCVAPKFPEMVNMTRQKCQESMTDIITENRLLAGDYDEFYQYAVERFGSSKSRMCGWAQSVAKTCLSGGLEDFCKHEGIRDAILRMHTGLTDYVCSLDPPVLECIMEPKTVQLIPPCTNSIQAKFGKYFPVSRLVAPDLMQQFTNFYNGEIKPNNGESVYREFKGLMSCMSDKVQDAEIKARASCKPIKNLLDDEADGLINFFKKTDILSCAFNPSLWTEFTNCFQQAAAVLEEEVKNRTTTPTTSNPVTRRGAGLPPTMRTPGPFYPGGSDVVTTEALKALESGNYKFFNGFYKSFRSCSLNSVEQVCERKWIHTALAKQYSVMDDLLLTDKPYSEFCEKLNKQYLSGAIGIYKMAAVNVVAAMILGYILQL